MGTLPCMHASTKVASLNALSCRSCVRTTRNGEAKFIQGDLIKVPKNFDLTEAPHGNLVARKKEAWGVIHAFTEPTSRNGEPVRAADRCVRCPHSDTRPHVTLP